MRIAFRTDASREIGTGHVRRCAALAEAIIAGGGDVRFLTRESEVDVQDLVPGHLDWLVATEGSAASGRCMLTHSHWLAVSQATDAAECLQLLLDWQPDWVVVDHYAIDARWHEQLGSVLGCRIAAIDDLGDRRLSVDALIDHNWHEDHGAKYDGLLNRECMMLCGPEYAMLGSVYSEASRYTFDPDVRSIGVFMGGTDHRNLSLAVLDATRKAGFSGSVDIATTTANTNLEHLLARAAVEPAVTVTVDLPDLAAFFASHDLQLGAGGGATWERFCIGAPSLLLAFAANHDSVLEPLAALGAASVLTCGWTGQELEREIARLLANDNLRRRYATRGQDLVDGKGASRLAAALSRVT
jgi:UDP-2,4-diacetamido-2,4,6-trideoxy-beta-L-altropyranose hydrolase